MIGLTDRQREVLTFMVRFQRENGFPATTREIAAGVGNVSVNSITDHFEALEKKGFIRRAPYKSRGAVVIRQEIESVEVPTGDTSDTGSAESAEALPYKVISLTLYTEDLVRLDGIVAELRRGGVRGVSRSSVIREAIERFDTKCVGRVLR